MQIKGILNFQAIFQAKRSTDAAGQPTGDPKFSCSLLIAPTDPQITAINAAVEQASRDTFPSGFPAKGDICWQKYGDKYRGKEYFKPELADWWVFSCTAKEADKPAVVNLQLQPVMDPAKVFKGAVVWVNAGISGYTKGTGGVGGWLNGVMITDEEPPLGRLDNKPSVEQMFANVGTPHHVSATGVVVHAPYSMGKGYELVPNTPAPMAPPAAPAPIATMYVMTALANGITRDAYIASGWSDTLLIQHGYMLPPNGVTPSFN
jgi:hypothetical protein